MTTLSSEGKAFSGRPRTAEEIAVYADGMADMFQAYVIALPSNWRATAYSPWNCPVSANRT
ncbi:hypothetical protein [Pseudomonas sp. RA_5y_Pfl1_P24]|uniref:hypothetical protein n=1 Tax=unclassified Pseudomonas TaxID=196821 RepID=UPI00403F4608